MINLTLRQLRYFEALARHGHFGQAAAACSVSQPALSVQIKDMEEILGAPLFERGTRQARLTGFGEALAPRVREILGAVDELGEMARATRGRLIGRLRIGVIPTVAPYLLPRVIAALTRVVGVEPAAVGPDRARAVGVPGLEFIESRPLGGVWLLPAALPRLHVHDDARARLRPEHAARDGERRAH